MIIKVTLDDIAAANKSRFTMDYYSHRHCPIARAASRVIGREVSVCHDGDRMQMYINAGTPLLLPIIAQEFVTDFDNGCFIEPIEFDV